MSYYEKNISVIKQKDNELYQVLINELEVEEVGEIKCSSVIARNGESILSIEKDEVIYSMGSKYNPNQEAIHFVNQYEKIIDYSYMIFLGLGNGLIAKELIRSKGKNIKFLYYEPSYIVFSYVIANYDLSELFKNDRVQIIVKGLNDNQLEHEIASHITAENYKWCILDALPLYRKLFEKDFKELEEKYRFYISLEKANVSTNQLFAKIEAYNNVRNMREFFHSNCEEEFEGVFPIDRPAIIVAAGPSLEKNAQLLKEVKGKLFIIAVDTALRYLVSQGIQPDLAVVADPKKPVRLFEDERVRMIPLALSSGANNEIIKKMADEKIIFVSAEPSYYEKIYNLAGKHSYMLTTGGSVATLAFMLARVWGYQKIILVGQDLALSEDKVHAGKDDIDLQKLNDDKIEIEGYYGEKVYTSPDYNFYREWYEMVIPKMQEETEFEVINATEGGSKIKGTVQKALREVINEYKDVTLFDFEGTIRNMPCTFNDEQRLEVIEMWKESINNFDELKEKLYDGIRRIKEGLKKIESREVSIDKVHSIQNRIKRIIEEINACEEIYFLACFVEEEEGDILSEIFEFQEDNMNNSYKLFERLLKYLNSMYMGIDEIKELFVELVESTENK